VNAATTTPGYADQNLRDYRAFIKAIREGRVAIATED
jgi:hypothetical protein